MGLHIQRKNVYSSPKYDSSFVSIPGRNGDLIVPNRRYENTQVSYSVYLSAKNSQQLAESITKIKAWLYAQPDRYHILKDSYDKRFSDMLSLTPRLILKMSLIKSVCLP